MSSTTRPTCEECPKFIRFREEKAKRQHGITMRPGERFCTAFPRARRFRPDDAKIYVPKWCPRRIFPYTLRIYREMWNFSFIWRDKKRFSKWISNPFDYRLKYEGTCRWTANQIKSELRRRKKEQEFSGALGLKEFLEAPILESNILELDDGVKPMFYLVTKSSIRQVEFDKERALPLEECRDEKS